MGYLKSIIEDARGRLHENHQPSTKGSSEVYVGNIRLPGQETASQSGIGFTDREGVAREPETVFLHPEVQPVTIRSNDEKRDSEMEPSGVKQGIDHEIVSTVSYTEPMVSEQMIPPPVGRETEKAATISGLPDTNLNGKEHAFNLTSGAGRNQPGKKKGAENALPESAGSVSGDLAKLVAVTAEAFVEKKKKRKNPQKRLNTSDLSEHNPEVFQENRYGTETEESTYPEMAAATIESIPGSVESKGLPVKDTISGGRKWYGASDENGPEETSGVVHDLRVSKKAETVPRVRPAEFQASAIPETGAADGNIQKHGRRSDLSEPHFEKMPFKDTLRKARRAEKIQGTQVHIGQIDVIIQADTSGGDTGNRRKPFAKPQISSARLYSRRL